MSGPKVVRIVTREEILEICRGHLARVDAALDEWRRIGLRNDCVKDEAINAAQRRRDALVALMTEDRFADLQKQAPIEAEFLRNDLQQRLAKVAAEQTAARLREQREREAASALLRALRQTGRSLDRDLEAGLERGDSDATARGLLLLGETGPRQADTNLVSKLRDQATPTTFAEWIRMQPLPPQDPAIDRISARMTEIAQISDLKLNWPLRLVEAGKASAQRRHLMLDALEVETGRALTAARQKKRAMSDLLATLAEAEASGLDTGRWRRDIASADIGEIEATEVEVASAIETHRETKAVIARRSAVLEGLSGLGYEVAEGMSTAWASEGRLVLRNAARPDYGVELKGDDRFQMRPVAFDYNGRGPDPARDKDAETIWCGDVTDLERQLAQLGDSFQIEKALPIGEVPLKRIEIEMQGDTTGIELPVLQKRTHR